VSGFIYCCAECNYAEYRNAECHYAEYRNSEYHNAECCYAECRGAVYLTYLPLKMNRFLEKKKLKRTFANFFYSINTISRIKKNIKEKIKKGLSPIECYLGPMQ
jgi:hypothetical protein